VFVGAVSQRDPIVNNNLKNCEIFKKIGKQSEKICSVFGGHLLVSMNFPPIKGERYYAYSSIVGGFLHL
jgi:hypothetical protein